MRDIIDLTKFSSINADHQSGQVSSKYAFIPTTEVVSTIEKEGWFPVQAQEHRIRRLDRSGFQKHIIRFQNPGIVGVEGIVPEIILTNSHDGCASFHIMAGLFRFACANGMIVANSLFAEHRIKHIGYQDKNVIAAVHSVTSSTPQIMSRIDEFQGIKLLLAERQVYADTVLKYCYSAEQYKELDIESTIKKLLRPLREEDYEPTLWNTFSTVQEKIIKGGRFERKKEKYRTFKKREVKSIDRNIQLNQALWAMTERMAEIKRSQA